MNKQELIEKVIENGAWCTENHTGETDRYVKISKVRELIRLLDEPRKPVVPKFVADWFEDNKDDLEYNIWSFIYEWRHHEMDDFKHWMDYGTNRPIETLIRMKDGYEVEKESLYVMPIPHVSFPVHYCVEDDHISFRQGNAQKFTQAELDKYFPDIKQFAVPVEKVAEG